MAVPVNFPGATLGGADRRCPERALPRVSHRQGGPMASTPTPNDQRSDVKNPNNPAQKSAQDNKANQLNPNHQPSKGQPAKK